MAQTTAIPASTRPAPWWRHLYVQVLLAIAAGIYYDGKRVTLKYLIMLTSCSVVMAIINVVLFKRILAKDCLISKKHASTANMADIATNFNKNSRHEQVNLLEVDKSENLKAFTQNGDLSNGHHLINLNSSPSVLGKETCLSHATSNGASLNMVNKKHH